MSKSKKNTRKDSNSDLAIVALAVGSTGLFGFLKHKHTKEKKRLEQKEIALKSKREREQQVLLEAKAFDSYKLKTDELHKKYLALLATIDEIKNDKKHFQDRLLIIENEHKEAGIFDKNQFVDEHKREFARIQKLDNELAKKEKDFNVIAQSILKNNENAKQVALKIREKFGEEGEEWYQSTYKEVTFIEIPQTIMLNNTNSNLSSDSNSLWKMITLVLLAIVAYFIYQQLN